MKDFIPKPRTDLEFVPTLYQGQRVFVVRDFLGLIQKPVVLQGDALQVFALLNGKRSVQDIQVELVRQRGGILVSLEGIEKLVSELDAAYLLESERYYHAKNQVLADYLRLEIRHASHAGQAYPLQKRDLQVYLDSLLRTAAGETSALNLKKIRALVAPHIDLEIGRRVYAKAYNSLQNSSPDIIFLLGTGHGLDDGYFSLTEKNFETPLGLIRTEQEAVRKLKKAGESVISNYDIAHRQEHSLEFQLIFCQHLFGSDFSLVPILCGSFRKELAQVQRPVEIPGVLEFILGLRELIKDLDQSVLIIASVDFSHIGPKFGHSASASTLLLEAKQHDKILINACLSRDVDAFWSESKRVKDYYNVCGLSALTCLLEILPESQGRLLDYDVWREEGTQSAVSFAAIAFEAK